MPNLLADYSAAGPGHDEMLQAQGAAKEAWQHLAGITGLESWEKISSQRDAVAGLLADQGIRSGLDLAQPWRLDPLPVMVDSAEWRRIEAGLAQRAQVLSAVLADLYGPRRLLLDGVLPAETVLGNPGFIRAADGAELPDHHQLFYTSAKLARNTDGWAVLSDSTDLLPGMGYVMADRRAVADVLSPAYSSLSVYRLGPFFRKFRTSLEALSRGLNDTPRVVVLVPGNRSTTFDQAYLADTLGMPIVTPEDLIVADGRLWLRTLGDAEPVDVVLRHLPSNESDPVDLTSTAAGGVPGLIEAAHSGSVAVVNPIGAGVLENPALLTYLPRICRHVLGEDLLLPSTVTYWCGERSMGSHVVANLERLLITSISTGETFNGAMLSIGERADLATQISATPHQWVGQEPIEMSSTPSVGSRELMACPTAIHTFAVADEHSYAVMPGGLGSTTVGSTHHNDGAIAKDVWVLTGGAPVSDVESAAAPAAGGVLVAGSAANLFDFGTQLERTEGVLRIARESHGLPGRDTPTSVSMEDVNESVTSLIRSAHLVRDRLTPEAWRALALLEQPAPFVEHLVNIMTLSGVLHESVTHDRSWSLLMLGKRLERARFLLQTALQAADSTEWSLPVASNSSLISGFLRLHDSLLSFRRHNQFREAIPSVIEILLLSRTNPRSLAFSILHVEEILKTLPTHNSPAVAPLEIVAALKEQFATVELRQSPPDQEELRELLTALATDVRRLSAAIRAQQFGSLGTALWTAEVEPAQVNHD